MYIPHSNGEKKIVILTGAGISAPSGIQTFRGLNGLWNNYKIDDICNEYTWLENYNQVHEFYNQRRVELENKIPNIAHLKIKEWMDKYQDDIILITQNIDDLFEKAQIEKEKILHLHGFLKEIICLNCNNIININYSKIDEENFICLHCNEKVKIKPNIVFFNGQAPMYSYMKRAFDYLNNPNSIFIVIGTSGNVIDVNRIAKKAYYSKKILANLEHSDSIKEYYFNRVHIGNIEDTIFKIEKDIETFWNK